MLLCVKQIALLLVDAGQEVPVCSEDGDVVTKSILAVDLWKPLSDFFPWKVGNNICG